MPVTASCTRASSQYPKAATAVPSAATTTTAEIAAIGGPTKMSQPAWSTIELTLLPTSQSSTAAQARRIPTCRAAGTTLPTTPKAAREATTIGCPVRLAPSTVIPSGRQAMRVPTRAATSACRRLTPRPTTDAPRAKVTMEALGANQSQNIRVARPTRSSNGVGSTTGCSMLNAGRPLATSFGSSSGASSSRRGVKIGVMGPVSWPRAGGATGAWSPGSQHRLLRLPDVVGVIRQGRGRRP